MENIYGINDKTAIKLKKKLLELGLIHENVEYTEDQYRKILKTPEIYNTLPRLTQSDIKYNPLKVIPRSQIELFEKELQYKFLQKYKPFIGGSYSRGNSTSRDIDLVISAKPSDWDTIKNFINEKGNITITDAIISGDGKIMCYVKGDRYMKIDVFLTNTEEYVFMKLYAIGSGLFNVRMRWTAKKKNYMLNQKGLFKQTGKSTYQAIKVADEKEIFTILGMKYLEPHERIR